MVKRLVTLSALIGLLSGCVNYNTYEEGLKIQENRSIRLMKEASIDLVKEYAAPTERYLAEHGEEKTIELAKEILLYSFKDPYSANFRNVRLVDYADGKVVCGEVNSKNAYGAYIGYSPFVASVVGAESYQRDVRRGQKYEDALNGGIYDACLTNAN